MQVRTATRDDCEGIAALHAASWRATYRDILSREYLDRHVVEDRHDLWLARFAKFDPGQHHVSVATDPAQVLLGFVCILLDEEPEHGALLDNLHVDPARHRMGAGRRLMARGAHWVATMRPDWAMHLWVYEANARTVAFYRATSGDVVDKRTIVTPAGNRAVVLRFEWRDPSALAARLDASFG